MRVMIAVAVLLVLGVAGTALYVVHVFNPRVADEIRHDPQGVRARETMLLTLPGGRSIPVNYLREGDTVFAGADHSWWRAFADEGAATRVLIRGQSLRGHARAVRDDPVYRDAVFARLRPRAPGWLPEWLKGTLVVITLDAGAPPAAAATGHDQSRERDGAQPALRMPGGTQQTEDDA